MSIDKALYSRQIYAVGAETQKKYSEADILLIGLSGLGVEIAKNLMLTGIRSLTLIDNNKISFLDLSTNFYATEEDVGRNRCDVLHPKIQELNSYVQVDSFDGEISELFVKKYHCIVIVDIGFSTELARNVDEWARSNNSKFISCETNGLTANIFTDFGDEFCITDSNGVDFPICLVTSISHDGLVVCHDDKSHQLQNGDYIVFSQLPDHCGLPNGIEFRVRNVQTPYNFFLEIPSEYKIENIPYLNAYVRGIKKSQYQSFESLEKSMKAPSFTISDFGKIEASMELHVFFQALHDFKIRNNKLPGAGEMGDAKEIISLMQKISPDLSFNEELYTNFAKMSSGSFVGLTAFIGGLAAHEVLKAISGKYTPIHQWYNFDVRECILPDVKDCERAPCNSRYDGQRVIFGDSCIKEFLRQKYFIVGAGALGCELMKNFALAGIGCSKEGSVTITDMDMIEKSNLSRQFLFRSNDIGKLKSECAAKAAQNMNRDLNVVAMQDKVAEETCEVFNDAFWENLTGVCTALDNISARLFVDAQCVKYRKPMVDSGTLGSKANAQVVIPQLTESYSSSRDPPEKSVPVCTLKNFPTAIEHTIQWARDAFEGLFSGQINDVVQFLSNEKFIESLAESEPAQLPHTINNIVTSLKNIPSSFSDCVAFARLQFEESFKNIILQLLYNFPLDSVTTSGAPFWTGPKKPPTPIEFSAQDDTHFEYIRSCAVLRANNFSIHFTEQDLSRENIIRVLDKVVVPPFQARKVKISTDENAKTEEQDASNLTYTMKDIPQRSQFIFLLDKLKLCSFEKDDDGNSHVAFITSCSNLRATNYKIPTADFDQTKKIAGSIIPAMVTTTALITGLVMIEVAKLITIPKNSWSLELFRNSFVSLEIALTAFSDPIAPSLNYYGPASDPRKNSWTMWDTIDVDIGRDVTLKEFIDYLYDTYSFEISMMSCGQGLIYSFFGNSSKNRLPLPVSEAVESVTKSKLSINQKYLYFEVVCSIEDVDVDIPTIKYRFRY